jgi:hypothetical protein
MSIRKDSKLLAEAYGSVGGAPLTPSNMLGGKPVMITMDLPGAEIDHKEHESHEGNGGENDPSEIEMASAELHKLAEYAPKLKEMVQNMSGLEGWIASKITKAADYISSVYHWLEFQQHEGDMSCSHGDNDSIYNAGHEDVESCPYAESGCKCGGCPNCH